MIIFVISNAHIDYDYCDYWISLSNKHKTSLTYFFKSFAYSKSFSMFALASFNSLHIFSREYYNPGIYEEILAVTEWTNVY